MDNEEVYEPRLCSVCGKDTRDRETGMSFAGISISFEVDKAGAILNNAARQFGPYWQGPNKTCYEICYECRLRSLGVVPLRGNS